MSGFRVRMGASRTREGTDMSQPITSPESGKILRASVWVAIGALIAAAIVCVVWVLFGDDEGIIGKAFLTVLLLAGFAGISIVEANLASRRPAWLALASMISWVLLLLIGAFMIWMPSTGHYGVGAERFFKFILIGLILQGALLHTRLFVRAYTRHQTTFTSIVTYVTLGLVAILAVMLVLPLVTDEFVAYRPLYWRVVVAIAILAAVGTALVPLVNAVFAPKRPRPISPPPPAAYYGAPAPAPAPQPGQPALTAWPTFADGVTPLPVLHDGSPDWNAYYTGYPTTGHPTTGYPSAGYPTTAPQIEAPQPPQPVTAHPPAPAQPAPPQPASWYQGYPPPPPVPPQQQR